MFSTEYIWHSIKNEKTVGVVEENELEGYVEEMMHGQKVVKVLKKDIKIKTILLLLITLIMNTYAWFIYISKVSVDKFTFFISNESFLFFYF